MERDKENKVEINAHNGAQVVIAGGSATVYATQNNSNENSSIKEEKFQNNKKQDYIKNWNSRLFLHQDNDENPISLADAFIMPDYRICAYIRKIGIFINNTLEQTIEKFINYNETSTMLIIGVPGMGKTTIASWLANKYKMDNNVIILRFRDWESDILDKGILKAICKTLACKKEDLENRVLILDGFDEMKSLYIREKLLDDLLHNLLDYENMKCIITSRPNYIVTDGFQNSLEIKAFDVDKIELFCKKVAGISIDLSEKIEENLDVLGIPVILYMAIMSSIDIAQKATKPELYTHIFAKKGGIFDRFSHDGVAYSKGAHIMRNGENIKKYLAFLQDVAFKMFEKNDLSLSKSEYKIPELAYEGNLVSVLEFPIKYLFENTSTTIEFIHKSLYEYFVSEYIYNSIADILNEDENIGIELAGVFGSLLKSNPLTPEILEFLKYRIRCSRLNRKYDVIYIAFKKMLENGMTYYMKEKCKNILKCEMSIFKNMLEVIHCWESCILSLDELIYYINKINVDGLNLNGADLRGNKGSKITIEEDMIKSNLVEMNKKGANFIRISLTEAKLVGADLKYADLREANLISVDVRGADLEDANLEGANIDGSIWYKNDIKKILPQLKESKFTYIIVEEQGERKKVYRNELFSDES